MLIIKLCMLVMFTLLYYYISLVSSEQHGFIFNGFQSKGLSLDGVAGFTSNGLLKITNATKQQKGHAFYPQKITFKQNSSLSSFSTTFVFAIMSKYSELSGHGLAFLIAPTRNFSQAWSNHYLGLFEETNNGKASNHVFAVELDIIQSTGFDDIDDNHVGIDINGLKSVMSKHAGYYQNTDGEFRNLTLNSGHPLQIWVDYDGLEKQLNVTLFPLYVDKPKKPLVSLHYDLSPIVNDFMYVGFTSSTGSVPTSHYVLGWSFMVNGVARDLDIVQLPKLPHVGPKERSKFVIIGLPLIVIFLVTMVISGIVHHVRKKWKYAEVLEDWELDYGPHRFKYKDLYIATKGFKENELLGSGGFGRVYRGVLNSSEIAVKRVSHESRQGMKEFVAEIVSIGRLRHRNIVPLLGYCRRKDELLLVYDYMPNGSLDKILFGQQPKFTFNWNHRFRVIKGVATGLNYLHQEWEQVVIHRDVKASNVLLDGELNGRLGDFGLARLYDHGTDPQTTHVVGTIGYLAPEHTRTGKATTSTDVFAFGAFLLEVTCGRRPIEEDDQCPESFILVDWVFSCWSRNQIVQAVDPRMGDDYVVEEVELVLKLGLLCSNSVPEGRPSMHQVVQYLDGYANLPELSSLGITAAGLTFSHKQGFSDVVMSFPSSTKNIFSGGSSVAESLLSGGR